MKRIKKYTSLADAIAGSPPMFLWEVEWEVVALALPGRRSIGELDLSFPGMGGDIINYSSVDDADRVVLEAFPLEAITEEDTAFFE